MAQITVEGEKVSVDDGGTLQARSGLCAEAESSATSAAACRSFAVCFARDIYLPADLKKWIDDTLECDLNRQRFSAAHLEKADIATMLGVAEYLEDTLGYSDR